MSHFQAKMRVLPKDHKDGPLKCRPIEAAIDAPATKLSKFLAEILYDLIRKHVKSHLNSSLEFIQMVKGLEISPRMKFASLDVTNLYGSIPIEDHMFPGTISTVSNFFERYKDVS